MRLGMDHVEPPIICPPVSNARAHTRGMLPHCSVPTTPFAKGPWEGLEDTMRLGRHHVNPPQIMSMRCSRAWCGTPS